AGGNLGGAIALDLGSFRGENVSFINNKAGYGGAIYANGTTIVLHTDKGEISLFSGNSGYQIPPSFGSTNNAIFFESASGNRNSFNITGDGILDMRDSLCAIPGDYLLLATKSDSGVWKL